MAAGRSPMYIGASKVMSDLGVSRAKSYMIIKELNDEMLRKYPNALVVNGKVNRIWYEQACLLSAKGG